MGIYLQLNEPDTSLPIWEDRVKQDGLRIYRHHHCWFMADIPAVEWLHKPIDHCEGPLIKLSNLFINIHTRRFTGWCFELLWKIWVRQLGWWHSQYFWENKIHGNQTTNQSFIIFRRGAVADYIRSPQSLQEVQRPGPGPGTAADHGVVADEVRTHLAAFETREERWGNHHLSIDL